MPAFFCACYMHAHRDIPAFVTFFKIFLKSCNFFPPRTIYYQMDATDYNACVRDWADALFRFACKCTGQQSDARDVVQNSFEVLWQKKGEVLPGKAKAYLFQVAYRQSVDNYRKRSKVAFMDAPEETWTPNNPDLKKILDRALAQLDDQSRALVLLKDYEGYSYEEIAQITALSDSQVKVYLHRARKTLKEYLVSVENII